MYAAHTKFELFGLLFCFCSTSGINNKLVCLNIWECTYAYVLAWEPRELIKRCSLHNVGGCQLSLPRAGQSTCQSSDQLVNVFSSQTVQCLLTWTQPGTRTRPMCMHHLRCLNLCLIRLDFCVVDFLSRLDDTSFIKWRYLDTILLLPTASAIATHSVSN